MEELIYKPERILSSIVKLIWFYDGYKPSSRIERVLPIGSSQIIINLGERSFRHFHNSSINLSKEYDDVILAGVQTRPVFLDSHTRISTMGVVLNPGAVPTLFQIPAEEFWIKPDTANDGCHKNFATTLELLRSSMRKYAGFNMW